LKDTEQVVVSDKTQPIPNPTFYIVKCL